MTSLQCNCIVEFISCDGSRRIFLCFKSHLRRISCQSWEYGGPESQGRLISNHCQCELDSTQTGSVYIQPTISVFYFSRSLVIKPKTIKFDNFLQEHSKDVTDFLSSNNLVQSCRDVPFIRRVYAHACKASCESGDG